MKLRVELRKISPSQQLDNPIEEFYLNNENRIFYTKAFDHIINCKNEYWGLDEHIIKHLDLINTNDNIRTIYSKRGKYDFGHGLNSYLTVCFTKQTGSKILNKILPVFTAKYKQDKKSDFVYLVEKPKI